MKVMIVDDDADCLEVTAYALRREGYAVTTAGDGKQALQRLQSENPDLVVLDVMLPKVNGFEVCRRIRAQSNVPIIMVTARDQDEDVVRGLDIGADDYVVKPFSHKQLVARIRTAMRRAGTQRPATAANELMAADMSLDPDAHEVIRGGVKTRLTPIEFRILYCLASNSGRLVSNGKLIEYVWGFHDGGDATLLKTHICHIRSKLKLQPGKPGYIKNVPGTGYALL